MSWFRSSGAPPPRWLTVLGTVEGYVAAGLTFALLVLPVTPGSRMLSTVLLIALGGLGLGLGVGGIRFGRGGGRVAAWFAVVVLLLVVGVLVVQGIWRWEEIARYWQSPW